MVQHALLSRRAALASGLTLAAMGSALGAESATIIRSDDGRDVAISIWPAAVRRRGIVLFSHGALSSPRKYERLLRPWADAGFEVFAPLHTDSTDYTGREAYPMASSWRTRLLDMRALSRFVGAPYIATGHSYGGLVALTLGGASPIPAQNLLGPLRDPNAKCVVAFSPPGPTPKLITQEGFATLAVPAFIETGDRDVPFGAKDDRWQVHLAAYDAAPPGEKYALVLSGVDHLFWRAYLQIR